MGVNRLFVLLQDSKRSSNKRINLLYHCILLYTLLVKGSEKMNLSLILSTFNSYIYIYIYIYSATNESLPSKQDITDIESSIMNLYDQQFTKKFKLMLALLQNKHRICKIENLHDKLF